MKKIFYLLLATATLLATGCNEQPDDNNLPEEDHTGGLIIKQMTLTNSNNSESKGVTILEDYNHRYNLRINRGYISIVPYYRHNGEYNNEVCSDMSLAGLMDVGRRTSIESITDCGGFKFDEGKNISGNGGCEYHATFQPEHAYVAMMQLDDNKVQGMVFYAKDYTLHDDGSLFTVTLQYKLID